MTNYETLDPKVAAALKAYYRGTGAIVPSALEEITEGSVQPVTAGALEPGEEVVLPPPVQTEG